VGENSAPGLRLGENVDLVGPLLGKI
jgi:hypothetical protein